MSRDLVALVLPLLVLFYPPARKQVFDNLFGTKGKKKKNKK